MVQNIVQKYPWDSETECSDLRGDMVVFLKKFEVAFC